MFVLTRVGTINASQPLIHLPVDVHVMCGHSLMFPENYNKQT